MVNSASLDSLAWASSSIIAGDSHQPLRTEIRRAAQLAYDKRRPCAHVSILKENTWLASVSTYCLTPTLLWRLVDSQAAILIRVWPAARL